jgi:hypothetical protein
VDVDGDGAQDLVTAAGVCDVIAWFRRTGPADFEVEPRMHRVADLDWIAAPAEFLPGAFGSDGAISFVAPFERPPYGLVVVPRACNGGAAGYGHGCPGSGGFVPRLGLVGCTNPNAAVTIEVRDGLGGQPALLFFGLAEGATPAAPPCQLLVAPLLPGFVALPLLGAGAGNGAIAVPAVLPAILSGVTFTMQAFTGDPGTAAGYGTTAGVKVSVVP